MLVYRSLWYIQLYTLVTSTIQQRPGLYCTVTTSRTANTFSNSTVILRHLTDAFMDFRNFFPEISVLNGTFRPNAKTLDQQKKMTIVLEMETTVLKRTEQKAPVCAKYQLLCMSSSLQPVLHTAGAVHYAPCCTCAVLRCTNCTTYLLRSRCCKQ